MKSEGKIPYFEMLPSFSMLALSLVFWEHPAAASKNDEDASKKENPVVNAREYEAIEEIEFNNLKMSLKDAGIVVPENENGLIEINEYTSILYKYSSQSKILHLSISQTGNLMQASLIGDIIDDLVKKSRKNDKPPSRGLFSARVDDGPTERDFTKFSARQFERIRAKLLVENISVPDGDSGEFDVPGGVRLGFDYRRKAAVLKVSVLEKPSFITNYRVWSAVEENMDAEL